MKKYYRTLSSVLSSPWAERNMARESETTDRVLRSTRLEDSIYSDLRTDDDSIQKLEEDAGRKLRSFPALSRDVFQSFYSLLPRRNEPEKLSTMAQKFNAPILDHITQSDDYSTLKSVCEGRELPAYEAASEFVSRTAGELDELMSDLCGDNNAMNTLEKLQSAEVEASEKLRELLERLQSSTGKDESLENAVIDAANQAESKKRQVEAVGRMIDTAAVQHREKMANTIKAAVTAASEKAQEVQSIIGAWSSEPGEQKRTPANLALLQRVRQSKALMDISRYLGRFREIFAQGRRNGYSCGRGEKYSLELGNDIDRALTSELAMLASPATTPLFLRKYHAKQIKQYKRREQIHKGMGDILLRQ